MDSSAQTWASLVTGEGEPVKTVHQPFAFLLWITSFTHYFMESICSFFFLKNVVQEA